MMVFVSWAYKTLPRCGVVAAKNFTRARERKTERLRSPLLPAGSFVI